jgi:glycosyltransferase involved in cell wall biosynthesis
MKIDVIPNSIDLKTIKKLAKENIEKKYRKIFKHKVIINVGNLRIAKGHWHLIRAFKEVKTVFPNIKLVIIGSGSTRRLTSIVKLLNLEEDVFFLGWQRNPYKFLSRSDIFVFPSLWEGFGIALLEAMACGIPIVASDRFKKIIRDCGLVVSSTDLKFYTNEPLTLEEKKLAEAIIKLLRDDKLRKKLSSNCRDRIKEFDITKVVPKYLNKIDELIGNEI